METFKQRAKIMQEYIKPTDRILDAGCGGKLANLTRVLNAKEIVAIDVNEKHLKDSMELDNRQNVSYQKGSVYEIHFSDNEFDAVVSGDMVEHLENPGKAISEMSRVVKDGGKVLISCPYHGLLKNIFITLFTYNAHYDVEGEHIRFFTKKSLEKLMNKYGLKVKKKHFVGRIPFLWKSMVFISEKTK